MGNGEEILQGSQSPALILQTLEELSGAAAFMQSKEISALVKDRASFAPVASVFTPDHIVYSGSNPLFVEANQDIRGAWKDHADKTGRKPKIVAVQGLGVFGAAAAEKAASLALDLFKDAVKVAAYSESFGGPRFMKQDKIDFINNWEVERYRSNVSAK
jgi:rhamnose utilization protein RhaD (predicted bifunctional aldolase and dehydrogenase)